MDRNVLVEKCNEFSKQNTEVLRLTKATGIYGPCWVPYIKKLDTIVELSEIFKYLPDVMKNLAFPRYNFEMCESCKINYKQYE